MIWFRRYTLVIFSFKSPTGNSPQLPGGLHTTEAIIPQALGTRSESYREREAGTGSPFLLIQGQDPLSSFHFPVEDIGLP